MYLNGYLLLCRICGNSQNNNVYTVKEMMIGFGTPFTYFTCGNCGCLQITEVPADIDKYYPQDYYSFKASPETGFTNRLTRYLKGKRHYFVMTGKGLMGWLLEKIAPYELPDLWSFRHVGLKKRDRILDVGSGTGIAAYLFKNAGFFNTQGIDPFIEKDIDYKNGLHIRKTDLFNIQDNDWNMIMFHHSFEHLDDPLRYLHKVYELLAPNGHCVIRIPTVSSFAWEHYLIDWVQLDAPRHFFLHSVKSMELLAHAANFRVKTICYDSTEFQFMGSEQYRRGIPLFTSDRSYYNGNHDLFTQQEIADFKQQAIELNRNKKGDSICVILQKCK